MAESRSVDPHFQTSTLSEIRRLWRVSVLIPLGLAFTVEALVVGFWWGALLTSALAAIGLVLLRIRWRKPSPGD